MKFLYPAPLSRLESLCAICDMQSHIARLEHFQAKRQSVRREVAINQSKLPPSRFVLGCVFVAIGAAAFAVTALYLKACASL